MNSPVIVADNTAPPIEPASAVPAGTDLIEWYYAQRFSDGFPVAPPTVEKVAAMLDAPGGEPAFIEARVPPRWGNLTREVLAINAVMAGWDRMSSPVLRSIDGGAPPVPSASARCVDGTCYL